MNFIERLLAQNPSRKDLHDVISHCPTYQFEAIEQLWEKGRLTKDELFSIFLTSYYHKYQESAGRDLLKKRLTNEELRRIINYSLRNTRGDTYNEREILKNVLLVAWKRLSKRRVSNKELTTIMLCCTPDSPDIAAPKEEIAKLAAEKLLNRRVSEDRLILIVLRCRIILEKVAHKAMEELLRKKKLSNHTLCKMLEYGPGVLYRVDLWDRAWERLLRQNPSQDDLLLVANRGDEKYRKLANEMLKKH